MLGVWWYYFFAIVTYEFRFQRIQNWSDIPTAFKFNAESNYAEK